MPQTQPPPSGNLSSRTNRPGAVAVDPFQVLRRHWIAIFASAVLGGAVGVGVLLFLSQNYSLFSGEVHFMVQQGLDNPSDIGTVDRSKEDVISRTAQTESYYLRSRDILRSAMDNPHIPDTVWYQSYVDSRGDFHYDDAVDELEEDVGTGIIRGTSLFKLHWSTYVPNQVPIVLNAIADAYMQNQEARINNQYGKNILLFQDQLRQTQRDLDDVEEQMQNLIRSKGFTTLSDTQHSAQAFRTNQLTLQLAQASNNLNSARTQFGLVQEQLVGTVEPSAVDYVEAERHHAVAKQIQLIQSLKAELRRLMQERHIDDPLVKRTESAIRAGEEERDIKLDEVIRNNLEARAKLLSDEIEQYQNAVDELENEHEKHYAMLQDLSGEKSTYDALFNRRHNLELRRESELRLINEAQLMRLRADATRIQLVQRAQEPRERAFPKTKVVISLAILIFVGITTGIVFLREILDQRIKSASDLAVLSGVRVLGDIPDLDDEPTKAKSAELAIRNYPQSVIAESYRQVCTSLFPLLEKSGHQTLLLVGGLPESGTTTVATNLAAAAANSGKRVLVVDVNFRRPRLVEAMGVSSNGVGFGEVITHSISMEDAVVDAGEGVSVIGTGGSTNNVFERLSEEGIDSVLTELRSKYDLIIFDTPPAVVAGEALILANKVDAAVLVVRAHQEQRGLVTRVIRRLSETQCDLLGVILNRPRGLAGGYLRKNYATMAKYAANAPA